MRDIGILFQGPMVRAVRADTKTQTRREVKWRGIEPGLNLQFSGLSVERSGSNFVLASPTRTSHEYRSVPQPCPYGLPGDRLWVRETFFAFGRWETRFSAKKGRDEWHFVDMTLESGKAYAYAADGTPHDFKKGNQRSDRTPAWWKRPAIHMPRAASRILLEVTGVRVERLQAISEEDAWAEGCTRGVADDNGGFFPAEEPDPSGIGLRGWDCARDWYADLWESINGEGSWDANQWVWVVEFRRVHPC